MKKTSTLLFLLLFTLTLSAQKKSTKELQLTQELLGAERKTIVAQNINLNILELKLFWPIYESFEKDRAAIVDKKIALLEKYLSNAEVSTDIELELINKQSLSLEKKLSETREKVYDELKKVLSVRVAMRFLQIDSHISSLLTVKILDQMPLNGLITKAEFKNMETQENKDPK